MLGVHVVLPVSGRIGRPTRSDAIVGAPGREIMLNDAVSISFDLYTVVKKLKFLGPIER